jgi:GNAT superfamily N-acetyltransferase
MMQLTRITKDNERYFLPLFPSAAAKASGDLIRIGLVSDEGAVAGALSARIYTGFIDILSLYIVPAFRREGCGRKLMDFMAELAKNNGYDALTWEYPKEKLSDDFSRAMGFELFEGRTRYSFTLGEFLRSPLYKKLVKEKKDLHVPTVSSLSHEEKKILLHHTGTMLYDPDWSTAYIANGKCMSCLLAAHEVYLQGEKEQNSIGILLLESSQGKATDFLKHIRALARKSLNEFGEDKDVVFRMTFGNEKIIHNMFELLGRKTHLHRDGSYVRAVKLL